VPAAGGSTPARSRRPERPCEDRRVKVNTPLGEYPFEFRGVERRGATVVISGTVAGLQSSAVLDRTDLAAAAKKVAPALGALTLAAIALHRARR
jgi:hypothetical protein